MRLPNKLEMTKTILGTNLLFAIVSRKIMNPQSKSERRMNQKHNESANKKSETSKLE